MPCSRTQLGSIVLDSQFGTPNVDTGHASVFITYSNTALSFFPLNLMEMSMCAN